MLYSVEHLIDNFFLHNTAITPQHKHIFFFCAFFSVLLSYVIIAVKKQGMRLSQMEFMLRFQ